MVTAEIPPILSLPLEVTAQVFQYLPQFFVLQTCARVCKQWLYRAYRTLTSFSNHSTLFSSQGGHDNEIGTVIHHLLAVHASTPTIADFHMYINWWLSPEGAILIAQRCFPRFGECLVSLTINYASYPALEELVNLRQLTFDFRCMGAPFVHKTPYSPRLNIVPWPNRAYFPRSNSLEELRVWDNFDSHERVEPLVPLRHPLPSVRRFEIRGCGTVMSTRGRSRLDLDTTFPGLEELDWEWRHNSSRGVTTSLILPPTVTALRLHIYRLNELPASITDLRQLKVLSVLHQRLPPAWDLAANTREGFPLIPILQLTSLESLKLVSDPNTSLIQLADFVESISQPHALPSLHELFLPHLSLTPSQRKLLSDAHMNLTIFETRDAKGAVDAQVARSSSILSALDLADRSPPIPVVESCKRCSLDVAVDLMEDHYLICRNTARECPVPGCAQTFVPSELIRHLSICPCFEIVCPACSIPVSRKEFNEHTAEHNRLTSIIQPPRLTFCAFRIPAFNEVLCKSCDALFPTLLDLLAHHCPQHGKKVDVRIEYPPPHTARTPRMVRLLRSLLRENE